MYEFFVVCPAVQYTTKQLNKIVNINVQWTQFPNLKA